LIKKENNFFTTFYKACEKGFLDDVEYYISVNNESVNEKTNDNGLTGLHYGLLFIE
jgi:hypothetical protein